MSLGGGGSCPGSECTDEPARGKKAEDTSPDFFCQRRGRDGFSRSQETLRSFIHIGVEWECTSRPDFVVQACGGTTVASMGSVGDPF